MNLFDVIPDNFFSVLSSPLKVLYADIIFLIYKQYLLVNFGLKRELVTDIIIEYLEDHAEDNTLQEALTDEIWEESFDSTQEIRSRANFIIRKLEQTGWIMLETYSNYEEYINITDYAIRVIDTLEKIRSNYQAEYQGYVYATYSLLYSREADRQGHIALEKAFEQTTELIQGLKSLQHNIKRYIERVIDEKEPQEILKLHFDEYKVEILDKSYHRLKTSDNVSKYRPQILRKINEWYHNRDWINQVALANVKREYQTDLEQARDEVLRQLDYIRQSYLNMDDLLEEIDRRNTRYANTSFLQLKYLLNSSRDVEGQLTDILAHLAEILAGEESNRDDDLPEYMAGLFSIFSQSFIDNESLYKPREISKNHHPQEITSLTGVDEKVKEESRQKLRQEFARRMTRKKINKFVLERMGENDELRARELVIENQDDFIKLIYAAAYSPSSSVDYRVDFTGERVTDDNQRYAFKNILFKKKRRQNRKDA